MDSTVEVALAAKLLKLFPSGEEKFLSFPMTGYAFTREDLDFLGDDEGLSAAQVREKLARKAQFARSMNLIPNDSLVYSTVDSFLWSEYARLLEEAELAESLLTDEEAEQLARAEAFLGGKVDEEGVVTEVYSPALEKYYEYKEAHEELERIYLDEELTAMTSEDPEEKREWETKRKPQLTELKNKALLDWQLLGHKDEVEKHQRIKTQLSGKIPRRYVIDYLNDLEMCQEPDLNSNDPIGTFSTFYSPRDTFLPTADWSSIHLAKSEVQRLLRDAPPELKRFASQTVDEIESLTVEYAKVVVMRPWLKPDFFSSRYWRLPQDELVSDGELPRSGRIPAFVTNLIVARKVVIERLEPTSQPAKVPAAAARRLRALRRPRQASQLLTVVKKVQSRRRETPARRATVRVRDHRRETPARRATVRVRDHRRRTATVRTPNQADHNTFVRVKARRTTVRRRSSPATVRRVSKPSPPPPPRFKRVTEEVDLNGVTVLAFVCRRVPKCPDPDTGLTWE